MRKHLKLCIVSIEYQPKDRLRVVEFYAIQRKQNQHDVGSNSFVTIHKWMIVYQSESKPC